MHKILIADDEEHIRDLVATTIGLAEQYELIKASDGIMALEKVKAEMPSIVFLDIRMPGLDGLEVCRRLKADEQTKDIHVIMLTAFGQEEDRKKGDDAGADDYFVKPFSPTALLDKVEEILNNK